MAGSFVRKGLVLAAGIYLVSVAFVFVREGGLGEFKRPAPAGLSPAISENPAGEAALSSEGPTVVIPKLGVHAAMQVVGLTPSGAIGIPTNYTDVAWFDRSARPGTRGTSIIVGHRDTRVFAPGVFRYLKDLVPGDDIYVYDGPRKAHFRVTGTRTYDQDTDRMGEITGQGVSGTHLNLITCDGAWNQNMRRYTERLVIFSELVE